MLEDADNGYGFIKSNPRRDAKPRKFGVTEIRGPYYSNMGKRYLSDVLETMGYHIDGLKFAGGINAVVSMGTDVILLIVGQALSVCSRRRS